MHIYRCSYSVVALVCSVVSISGCHKVYLLGNPSCATVMLLLTPKALTMSRIKAFFLIGTTSLLTCQSNSEHIGSCLILKTNTKMMYKVSLTTKAKIIFQA